MRDVKFMSIVKMTKCFSIIGHYVYNISLMAYLNVTEKKKKKRGGKLNPLLATQNRDVSTRTPQLNFK